MHTLKLTWPRVHQGHRVFRRRYHSRFVIVFPANLATDADIAFAPQGKRFPFPQVLPQSLISVKLCRSTSDAYDSCLSHGCPISFLKTITSTRHCGTRTMSRRSKSCGLPVRQRVLLSTRAAQAEPWWHRRTGAHSNVGGGFSDTTMDTVPILAHCSLRWMLRESVEQGLFLNPRALRTSPILIPFVPAAVKACSQTDQSPTNDDGNNAADAGVDDNEDVKISADGSVAVEDQAFILALVTEAARPPASSADAAFVREAALAPRGDSLSFDIPRGPKTSTLRNFKRRLLTSLWWLMEITPTLRVRCRPSPNVRGTVVLTAALLSLLRCRSFGM